MPGKSKPRYVLNNSTPIETVTCSNEYWISDGIQSSSHSSSLEIIPMSVETMLKLLDSASSDEEETDEAPIAAYESNAPMALYESNAPMTLYDRIKNNKRRRTTETPVEVNTNAKRRKITTSEKKTKKAPIKRKAETSTETRAKMAGLIPIKPSGSASPVSRNGI